jgi:hypothetical protein
LAMARKVECPIFRKAEADCVGGTEFMKPNLMDALNDTMYHYCKG